MKILNPRKHKSHKHPIPSFYVVFSFRAIIFSRLHSTHLSKMSRTECNISSISLWGLPLNLWRVEPFIGQPAPSGTAKFAMLRRQFVHLPSVGTWLRRLPDPIKVCPEPTLRSQKMRNVKAWEVAKRMVDWLVWTENYPLCKESGHCACNFWSVPIK